MRSKNIFDKAVQTEKCFKRLNFVQVLSDHTRFKALKHGDQTENVSLQNNVCACFIAKYFPFGHCFSAIFMPNEIFLILFIYTSARI